MKLSDSISLWIKQKVENAGAKGVVLGLSGGIDSAVVAALAKKAVGIGNVLCLILPIKSNPQDEVDATLVAKSLGLSINFLNIEPMYNIFPFLDTRQGLASSNLKARLRMCTIYYYANYYNYLVLGTGNKSEISIGYFTKYGDGGCDLLPIGDLTKTRVYKLAKELKIPAKIIKKAPSAGLWEGQTDEGEMGFTYKELDAFIDNKFGVIKVKTKILKIQHMMMKAYHKKNPIPVCPCGIIHMKGMDRFIPELNGRLKFTKTKKFGPGYIQKGGVGYNPVPTGQTPIAAPGDKIRTYGVDRTVYGKRKAKGNA